MSILVDFNAATRTNSLVDREFTRRYIVGTLESFAIGQVVRIASDPLKLETGENNKGAIVIRKASKEEFLQENPEGIRSHNAALVDAASFYEVGID